MKHIIIDTNFVYHDFYLRGMNIMALTEYVHRLGYNVYMSQIVLDEMVNHHRKAVDDQVKKIEEINDAWQKLSNGIPLLKNVESKEVLDQYNDMLRSRCESLQISILGYPSVKHQEVVKRDLDERRPFRRVKSGNIGYRDTLIWESILEFCQRAHKDSEILFITKNTKDFSDEEGEKLHADLKDDLKRKNLPEDRVTLITNPRKFLNEEILADLQVLEHYKDEIVKSGGVGDIDVKTIVNEKLDIESMKNFIIEDEYMGASPFVPPYYENPDIAFSEVNSIDYDVRKLSDEVVAITAIAKVSIDMDAYIFKADLALIDDDEMPELIDRDWNKHYVLAADHGEFTVKINILVDADFKEVTSVGMELIGVSYDTGYRYTGGW